MKRGRPPTNDIGKDRTYFGVAKNGGNSGQSGAPARQMEAVKWDAMAVHLNIGT